MINPSTWFKGPVRASAEAEARATTYIVLNPALALTKVREAGQQVQDRLSFHNNFIHFAYGQLGWKLDEVLKQAVETGLDKIEGHDYGSCWFKSLELREIFARAIWETGFAVSFHRYTSDGPEADRIALHIRPRDYNAKFNKDALL